MSKREHLYTAPEGPLNKTPETILFEQIVEDLASDRADSLEFSKSIEKLSRLYENAHQSDESRKKYEQAKKRHDKKFSDLPPRISLTKVVLENGKEIMYLKRNGERININELLKKVNMTHLNLSDKARQDYEYIYKKDEDLKIEVQDEETIERRLREAYTDKEEPHHLKKLSYAEQIAIQVYTSKRYQEMNGIMRGDKSPAHFDRFLMDIAFASQGLSKLPTTNLPKVARRQRTGTNIMQTKVETGEIDVIDGFTSASHKTRTEFGNITIVYSNVQGVDIAPLSMFPEEREYLIPPSTQVQYTDYKVKDGKYIFFAKGKNVLIEKQRSRKFYNKLAKIINKVDDNKIDMKDIVDEALNLYVENGLITQQQKSEFDTKNKSGKSPFDQEFEEVFIEKKLSKKDRLILSFSKMFEKKGLKKLSKLTFKLAGKTVKLEIERNKQAIKHKLHSLDEIVNNMKKQSSTTFTTPHSKPKNTHKARSR